MDYFKVFQPFYIFSKIIGLYSFSVSCHRDNFVFNFTIANVFYAIAASCCPVVFALFFNLEQPVIINQFVLTNLWSKVALFGLIFPAGQVIHHHIKSKSTAKFLQNIIKFDEDCRHLGIFLDLKTELKVIRFTMMAGLIIVMAILAIPLTQMLEKMPILYQMFSSHGLQFFHIYYGVAEMFIVIRAVFVRIEEMTKYLEKTVFTTKRQLKQFLNLFNELCDLIDLLNSTFSMNVIFVLGNILLMVTIGVYSSLQGLTMLKNIQLLGMGINTLVWSLIQFILACVIVNAGWKVQTNASKMSSTAIKRLNSSTNERINHLFRDLISQLRSRDIKIECIFFTVDWGVIFGVRNFK